MILSEETMMEVMNQTLIWINARCNNNEHDEGLQFQTTNTVRTQSCHLHNDGYFNFITTAQIFYRLLFIEATSNNRRATV